MMTTRDAADRLGIKARSVVWAIKKGYIKAEIRGRDYWIEESEIERYEKERRPAHRPRGDKAEADNL
jgi:excisionase family DNA binding protein